MQSFVYSGLPARVVFGAGTLARLGEEVARLGFRRALVLSTAPQKARAEALAASLAGRAAGTFAGAVMHTPVDVTDSAMETVRALAADGLVAYGGGSTIGLGKAIALRTDLPQIVIPTTYAGSEMTAVVGETSGGVKTTKRDMRILPETVIYDVELTLSLPPRLSAVSGLNALAHSVEALYSADANPIISLMAEESARALAAALPRVIAAPDDIAARGDALYGAFLAGVCLGVAGMALHHKLAHVLGGSFDLPHAETHAVLLPHTFAYNAAAAPEAVARLARAFGTDDPVAGLADLARRLKIPPSLAALGMPEDAIDRAADMAVASPYPNPRPLDREAIRALIAAAHAGASPGR